MVDQETESKTRTIARLEPSKVLLMTHLRLCLLKFLQHPQTAPAAEETTFRTQDYEGHLGFKAQQQPT